jgi:hypothetical protein
LRRLPRFEPVEEKLEPFSLEARLALSNHLLGVVVASPSLDDSDIVDPFREALAASGVTPSVKRVPAFAESAVLERLFEELRAGEPCITVGALPMARLRPKLALLYTGGARPSAWSPAARALRSAFDLELPGPRPSLLAALAAHPSIIACRRAG